MFIGLRRKRATDHVGDAFGQVYKPLKCPPMVREETAMNSVPESFQRYGTSVLARTPQVAHQWSAKGDGGDLFIPTVTPSGFDIDFLVLSHAVTQGWGTWHTPLTPDTDIDAFVERLFGLLRGMRSPDMRVRELRAWPFSYRGFLESYDGDHGSTEQEMGLMLWN
jgi:hypothetical protein